MNIKFGTSGVRGLNTDLTNQVCYSFAKSFLVHAESRFGKKTAVVAIDRRMSGPRIQAAVAAAARDKGVDIRTLGVIPTPALAIYCQNHDCYGIMITGSHIPADRNGLKFYFPTGEILKDDEAGILEQFAKIHGETAHRDITLAADLESEAENASHEFIRRYTEFFAADCLRGFKILFYEHSSTCYRLAPAIFKALGAEVVSVGASQEFVSVDTEAVTALEQMRRWQAEYGADVVVSTDGDGDRPLVVDDTGQLVRGDVLGMLTALGLGLKNLAVPVSCNSSIEACEAFDEVVLTKIGSPFVIAAMDELLAKGHRGVAGFEANGGFLLATEVRSPTGRVLAALATRDSILPIVQSLAYAREQKLKLSSVVKQVQRRHTASDLIREISPEHSSPFLAAAVKDPKAFCQDLFPEMGPLDRVNTLDGLRLFFANGEVVHLRPSGNAPEFRVYTEAADGARAEELCYWTLKRVSAHLKQRG
jgi:phosphomannomutase